MRGHRHSDTSKLEENRRKHDEYRKNFRSNVEEKTSKCAKKLLKHFGVKLNDQIDALIENDDETPTFSSIRFELYFTNGCGNMINTLNSAEYEIFANIVQPMIEEECLNKGALCKFGKLTRGYSNKTNIDVHLKEIKLYD